MVARRSRHCAAIALSLIAAGTGLRAGSAAAQETPGADTPVRYERVPLREIGAFPKRYHNHPLEIARAKCLRGGPQEYRCVPAEDGDLTFILRSLEPAGGREIIDRDCTDLTKTLQRASCTVTLRVVPRSELNMEVRGMARTIIGAPVGYVTSSRSR